MSKTSELKVLSPKAEIAEVPDFLKSEIGHQAGMENVEQGDLLLPRLGLCQALSPQKRKSHSLYIPGLEEGQLFNTVTKEIYGERLDVVMLFFFKNRIKYFPIDSGGGLDCISANGIDGGRIRPDGCSFCNFSKFGNGETSDEKGNDAPECTLYHNYMCFTYATPVPSPIALSYKSTGLKVSKQMLSEIRLSRLPMYAKTYKISSVTVRRGDQEWFEKSIIATGFVDKELFSAMEQQFNALKEMNIKVDTTGEEGDESFKTESF